MRRWTMVLLAAAACAAPGAARADAPADSAKALRALIRVDAVAAEMRARRWLAEVDAAAPPDSVRALALDVVSESLLENGHWGGDAAVIAERAVRARQRAYGDSSGQAGVGMISLGRLLYRRAEHEAARSATAQGLRLCERAYGPIHRSVYRGTRYLANIDEELADFASAERLYRLCIVQAESLYGATGAEYGQALNSFAVMCRKTGRYSEARELYERSLAIRERALGLDHRDLVFNISNLANLLGTMGDASAAKALYERDLRIIGSAYGRWHPYYAALLNNLASADLVLGDTSIAIAHLREARAVWDSIATPNRPEVARVYNNLGTLEAATGDTAQARVDLNRGLAERVAIYGRDHPEIALSLEPLGELALIRGDAAAALRCFDEALALDERHLGPEVPEVAGVLVARGRARRLAGDDRGALEDALRGERVATDHLRVTARVLEERVALLYALTRPSGLDLALTLAAEHPDDRLAARRVWDTLIRSRALVLDEMAHRHRAVVTTADELTRRLADSLATANEGLARLTARAREAGADSVLRERLATMRVRRAHLEFALAERSASFRTDVRRDVAGIDSVMAALGRGDVLVSFVRYAHQPAPGRAWRSAPTSRYLALVASGDSLPRVVPLGETAAIEPLVKGWLEALERPPAPLSRATDMRRCRVAGSRVRARVWDPIRAACAGAARVLVVPDGALQRAPFAALPAAGGGYEAEHGPAVHLLSAERDIVAAANREPAGRGLLAVGAPDFDREGTTPKDVVGQTRGAQSACESFRSLRFGPLPGARIEIGQVAREWRAACVDSQAGVLLGAAADERALRALAPGRRVLHLATHGFYLGAACVRRDRIDSLALEDPLLRSGLSLAGANLRAGPADGEDDGILTAAEVATLNLDGVEWAVLSACETARGDIQDGEGVLGLRRGFAIAGVRTLVSSLWAVDDASTGRWMEALYAARFARHLGTAEAVQEAQRSVLKARRAAGLADHPYYWAGFVAAGDWR